MNLRWAAWAFFVRSAFAQTDPQITGFTVSDPDGKSTGGNAVGNMIDSSLTTYWGPQSSNGYRAWFVAPIGKAITAVKVRVDTTDLSSISFEGGGNLNSFTAGVGDYLYTYPSPRIAVQTQITWSMISGSTMEIYDVKFYGQNMNVISGFGVADPDGKTVTSSTGVTKTNDADPTSYWGPQSSNGYRLQINIPTGQAVKYVAVKFDPTSVTSVSFDGGSSINSFSGVKYYYYTYSTPRTTSPFMITFSLSTFLTLKVYDVLLYGDAATTTTTTTVTTTTGTTTTTTTTTVTTTTVTTTTSTTTTVTTTTTTTTTVPQLTITGVTDPDNKNTGGKPASAMIDGDLNSYWGPQSSNGYRAQFSTPSGMQIMSVKVRVDTNDLARIEFEGGGTLSSFSGGIGEYTYTYPTPRVATSTQITWGMNVGSTLEVYDVKFYGTAVITTTITTTTTTTTTTTSTTTTTTTTTTTVTTTTTTTTSAVAPLAGGSGLPNTAAVAAALVSTASNAPPGAPVVVMQTPTGTGFAWSTPRVTNTSLGAPPVVLRSDPAVAVSLPASSFAAIGASDAVVFIFVANLPAASNGQQVVTPLVPSMEISIFPRGSSQPYNVSNLTEPIYFKIADQRPADADEYAGCGFWDPSTQTWSTAGVSTATAAEMVALDPALGALPGQVWCKTTHLSFFSFLKGLLKTLLEALMCANINALSPDGLSAMLPGSGWTKYRAAGLHWFLLTILLFATALGIYNDWRWKKKGLDRNKPCPNFPRGAKRFGMTAKVKGLYRLFFPYPGPAQPEEERKNEDPKESNSQRDDIIVTVHDGVIDIDKHDHLKHATPPAHAHDPNEAAQRKLAEEEGVFAMAVIVECVQRYLAVAGQTEALLSMTALQNFGWGKRGWMDWGFPEDGGAFGPARAQLHTEVPRGYVRFFGTMNFFQRLFVLFMSYSPLHATGRYDPTMSAFRRGMLLIEDVHGPLMLSAAFMTAGGEALAASSSKTCTSPEGVWARYIVISLASMILYQIPRRFLDFLHWQNYLYKRRNGNKETCRVQFNVWDYFFWAVYLAETLFFLIFVLSYVSNLTDKDMDKWITVLLTVVLRMLIVQPLVVAFVLAAVASLLAYRRPQLLAEAHLRLDFVLTEEQATLMGKKPLSANRRVVEDLARRGISLRHIIAFYHSLPEVMGADWKPESSQTHEVVRKALIPLSYKAGEARGNCYSVLASGGKPRLPAKMVTHGWGNIFSHLIAAVLADALGSTTVSEVLHYLDPEKHDDLVEALEARGALDRAYWICAMCVNQHAGICDKQGCSCPTPKIFTGDLCEMNKFDDMMALLYGLVPGFGQVVAVDRVFTLFTRAWCIAELVEAHNLRLKQALKIYSAEGLEEKRDTLKALDVRECQASFPADKDLILGKIEDMDEFNTHMRDIILNRETGLLANCLKEVVDHEMPSIVAILIDSAVVAIAPMIRI